MATQHIDKTGSEADGYLGRCAGRPTSDVRLELESEAPVESKSDTTASLFSDPMLRPEEAVVLEILRCDASLQIEGILELLETQLTSSVVFTALFELKMAGRVRCMPGENYVRTMRERN